MSSPAIPLKTALTSTVGRKLVMAVSGLGLIGFVVAHLLGNLVLYRGDADAFNAYAKFLHDLGPVLIVAELGLVTFFGLHVWNGIQTARHNRAARPIGYAATRTKGGTSMNSPASRGMIWTGLALLAFVILHLKSFKYGPGAADGYVTQINGEEARDLYRLVVERFQDPLYSIVYVAAMSLLGFHLRHGFWSAFQSLGILAPRYRPLVQVAALGIAALLAVGFLGIPVWIYFDLGGQLQ